MNTLENSVVISSPAATLSAQSTDAESGIVDFYTQYNLCPLAVNILLTLWYHWLFVRTGTLFDYTCVTCCCMETPNIYFHTHTYTQSYYYHLPASCKKISNQQNNSIRFQRNLIYDFQDNVHNKLEWFPCSSSFCSFIDHFRRLSVITWILSQVLLHLDVASHLMRHHIWYLMFISSTSFLCDRICLERTMASIFISLSGDDVSFFTAFVFVWSKIHQNALSMLMQKPMERRKWVKPNF